MRRFEMGDVATEDGSSRISVTAAMCGLAARYIRIIRPQRNTRGSLRSPALAELMFCSGNLSYVTIRREHNNYGRTSDGVYVDNEAEFRASFRAGKGRRGVVEDWRLVSKGERARGFRFRPLASFLVVVWALVEIPVEVAASRTVGETAALFFAKIIIVALAIMATLGKRWAEAAFMFVCALSVLAIVPSLYLEFKISLVDFVFSSVECFIKALAVIAYVRARE